GRPAAQETILIGNGPLRKKQGKHNAAGRPFEAPARMVRSTHGLTSVPLRPRLPCPAPRCDAPVHGAPRGPDGSAESEKSVEGYYTLPWVRAQSLASSGSVSRRAVPRASAPGAWPLRLLPVAWRPPWIWLGEPCAC